jgi:hypothetical protein
MREFQTALFISRGAIACLAPAVAISPIGSTSSLIFGPRAWEHWLMDEERRDAAEVGEDALCGLYGEADTRSDGRQLACNWLTIRSYC